jgi:hypothetical protein
MEYFVAEDGNDAASGAAHTSAWATVQHAVDSASPADVITVLPGRYTGCRIRISGTEANPITLRAQTTGTVTLDTVSPDATHDTIIDFDRDPGAGVGYWIVQGFTVTGAPRYGIALFGYDAARHHHIRILNNHVAGNGVTGIFTAFSDDIEIGNNVSEYNGEHGLYVSNSSRRYIIRGNTLRNNAYAGIHLNGDEHMGGDGVIRDVVIERNVIQGNGSSGASGINMDGVIGGRVVNNLLYDEHASGISLYDGDASTGTQCIAVFHNTIITAADGRWALNMTSPGTVSNRFYNNILYTHHSWRGAIAVPDPIPAGFESDHNVVMDRFSVDAGDNRIDFAAWQALGYGAHSVIATPEQLFVSPGGGNYHVKPGCAAVDLGASLPSVTNDLDGVMRPLGAAPDAGCYERDPEARDHTLLWFSRMRQGGVGRARSAARGRVTPAARREAAR